MEPSLWAVETLTMGKQTGCLDTQKGTLRHALLPSAEGRIAGPAVVAAVEFNRIKSAQIEVEALLWRYVMRIEYAVPVCIAPP
jgi:hypothetical protein